MEEKIIHRTLPKQGTFLARLMSARSLNEQDPSITEMLHHSTLTNARLAARIIADAIHDKKRITIAGDYDVDGATGVAIGVRGMRLLGGDPSFIVPDRMRHGYGLSPALVDVIFSRGVDLIVTVDNGISSVAGVDRATQLGIPVIVTDHHLPGEILPNALCIVNPNQKGCSFESKGLSGAGVMFYVMMALRAEMIERGAFKDGREIPKLGAMLDLVALSIIADIVPLDKNNRILARAGLRQIRSKRTIPMISALFTVAKRSIEHASSADLGFAVGPRLNAAGRLEDMTVGIKGLLTDNAIEAARIAAELNDINQQRKEIETAMKEDAIAMLDAIVMPTSKHSIVLFSKDWHAGVIGILASRVKEAHNLPSIMFASGDNGILKGSARSIPQVHIRDAISAVASECPDIVLTFGGHAMAAGLTIREDALTRFASAFDLAVKRLLGDANTAKIIATDGEMPKVSVSDIDSLEAEPWGSGYPPPEFDGQFEVVSQKLISNGQHLKLKLKDSLGVNYESVMFFRGSPLPSPVHLIFAPSVNEWQGARSVQLLVKQVFSEPADTSKPVANALPAAIDISGRQGESMQQSLDYNQEGI